MSARKLHLYIEGDSGLRAGFSQLFKKAFGESIQKHQVELQASMGGSNSAAFNLCRRAPANDRCVLLIDADFPVVAGMTAREHLQKHYGWDDLRSLAHEKVHLMVVEMEAWLVCDPEAWKKVFGRKFNSDALPTARNIETVDKKSLTAAIDRATRETVPYKKVKHGVRLLEELCFDRVVERAPHAKRFFEELNRQIAS